MKNKNEQIIEKILIDQKLRTGIAIENHQWFFNIYFNHYVNCPAAPFHKEFFRLTEKESIKNLIILAFRGSAKTSIMGISYPIWSIVGKQQRKFVVIIGQTQRQARAFLFNIKKEFETNRLLLNDFCPFEEQSDEWGSYSLVLPRYGARITAVSMEQTIRSLRHRQYRPDLIISDDIEDTNSVRVLENRDKLEDWICSEIIPAGDKNTRFIYIGNLLHRDSFLMRAKKRIEEKKMDGIFKAYPLIDNKGKITWTGKYPNMAAVTKEQRKGTKQNIFEREFLLKICDDKDQVIKENWIKYYDQMPDEKKFTFLFTITGIDLAISEKKSADYTAMVSARIYKTIDANGEDKAYVYILPDPINKRMDFPKTLETAKEVCKIVGYGNPTKLLIEDVGYQRSLIQQLQKQGFEAEGFKCSGQDKRSRLSSTTYMIKEGFVLFPRTGAKNLINQIVNFGSEQHDDLSDAFVMVVLNAMGQDIKTYKATDFIVP